MWIFTPFGFFSAVCGRRDGQVDETTIMVRARKDDHLQALKRRFLLEEAIQESIDTDYRYRIILSKTRWAHIVSELAQEIDYTNFKAKVAEASSDGDYESALHRVWSVMHSIQPPTGRGANGSRLSGNQGASQKQRRKHGPSEERCND
jgi:hypothetical protein